MSEQDNQVTIEVDGRTLTAQKGQMLIEVTDENGIAIPRFCYHKKLSVAANCRMCLVDVEKAPKPLPACATPVMDGMRVQTKSARALSAQKGTMEFLLINHPLDCPICDQGGECELQDVAMGYGESVSRYAEAKRVVADKDIGPLIETEMTRCIHCTRCVRFGEEVAGVRELGGTGRGENLRIGTYVAHTVSHELSGNVIDLCPVGALTAKPSRYAARAWEYEQTAAVSAHDPVGANTWIHTRNGELVRVVPRENEPVNETWISDRDRFSYVGNAAANRVTRPMRKHNGEWQAIPWETALEDLAESCRAAGGERVAALVGASLTIEEYHLAGTVLRGLGVNRLDHRLDGLDFSDQDAAPLFPYLGSSIESLEHVQTALLVGCNPRSEAPLLAHRLRKAALRGATLASVGPELLDLTVPLAAQFAGDERSQVLALAAIAAAVVRSGTQAPETLAAVISAADDVDDTTRTGAEQVATRLQECEDAVVILGQSAAASPVSAALRALAAWVAEATGARFGYLPSGANAAGAWLAGMLPHRAAAGAASECAAAAWSAWTTEDVDVLLVSGVSGAADVVDGVAWERLLAGAGRVVALVSHADDDLREHADLLLPIASPFETSGTFANAEGRWQSFRAQARMPVEVRPGWKVWRVLGDLLGQTATSDILDSKTVRDRLASGLKATGFSNALDFEQVVAALPAAAPDDVLRVQWVASQFHGDALTRASAPLMAAPAAQRDRCVRVNPAAIAPRTGLANGHVVGATLEINGGDHSRSVEVELLVDAAVPAGVMVVARGTDAACAIGGCAGVANARIARLAAVAAA